MPRFAVELEYRFRSRPPLSRRPMKNHARAAACDAACWDHAETDYDSCTGVVGCRKLPKAMARTIAAMAPGCILATK